MASNLAVLLLLLLPSYIIIHHHDPMLIYPCIHTRIITSSSTTPTLSTLGLAYSIPKFKEMGIDTPTKLAELELPDYDLVGVTDTDHRKKLFFLVQRVKMVCMYGWM